MQCLRFTDSPSPRKLSLIPLQLHWVPLQSNLDTEYSVFSSMYESRSVLSDSLRPHALWPVRLLCPWDSPGKNTGVDCHFLLQGIFPTQGSNSGLPHCRQILYQLSHQGSRFSSTLEFSRPLLHGRGEAP